MGKAIASVSGAAASSAPKPVAMPLPPLKPIIGEKVCPRIAATPTRIASTSPAPARVASQVGRKPFSASSISTVRPTFAPSTRNTFVAPMLPLPTLRMSTPRSRAAQYPNGSAPAQNDAMIATRRTSNAIASRIIPHAGLAHSVRMSRSQRMCPSRKRRFLPPRCTARPRRAGATALIVRGKYGSTINSTSLRPSGRV
jgi:hypothetical protein